VENGIIIFGTGGGKENALILPVKIFIIFQCKCVIVKEGAPGHRVQKEKRNSSIYHHLGIRAFPFRKSPNV